jgi:hypothetical protein
LKKIELLKLLSKYEDHDEILVESADGGFDSPTIYISAVRVRLGKDYVTGSSSEYVNDTTGNGSGAVILGTSVGFTRLR